MTFKDTADIVIKIHEGTRFYWNFYFVAVVALIGWSMTTEGSLSWWIRIGISIIFIFFYLANVVSLWANYRFQKVALEELRALAEREEFATDGFLIELQQGGKIGFPSWILLVGHGMIGLITLALILDIPNRVGDMLCK